MSEPDPLEFEKLMAATDRDLDRKDLIAKMEGDDLDMIRDAQRQKQRWTPTAGLADYADTHLESAAIAERENKIADAVWHWQEVKAIAEKAIDRILYEVTKDAHL